MVRIVAVAVAGLVLSALSGCAARPPPATPANPQMFGGGWGSAVGNYPAEATGRMVRVPDGRLCPEFAWDRPLPGGRVVRLLSASCPAAGRPGAFDLVELGRETHPDTAGLAALRPEFPTDPVAPRAPVAVVERVGP